MSELKKKKKKVWERGSMVESVFSFLPEDVVFKIFFKLQDDPRNWARLACVCTKFSSIVRNVCCKAQCYSTIPNLVSDLLSSPSAASASSSSSTASDLSIAPPGGWDSLYKLAVCCPGLYHAGILLENSDFGLERELGPDQGLHRLDPKPTPTDPACNNGEVSKSNGSGVDTPTSYWSLYDDLYTDTLSAPPEESNTKQEEIETSEIRPGRDHPPRKRRKICRSLGSHLAAGPWTLSREQGNKLLASRFRGDCLYICNWPGCIHVEEKRNYMLFRGIFKDFKKSRVWRTINDGNRSKILGLKCAFCKCDETWDLHSSFCLRRVFGFHDDGEPVVRAYVCDNGHVSGAWTALPLYT